MISGTIQAVSSHPVHLLDKEKKTSPSAFIPFCEFGGNVPAMSINNDNFKTLVCNSFKARILNDQLCYEIDLHQYNTENDIAKKLKLGLVFFIDYNEDRQITLDGVIEGLTHDNFVSAVDKSSDDEKAFIYLNTIGINTSSVCVQF